MPIFSLTRFIFFSHFGIQKKFENVFKFLNDFFFVFLITFLQILFSISAVFPKNLFLFGSTDAFVP